jgi:hypothetical protein
MANDTHIDFRSFVAALVVGAGLATPALAQTPPFADVDVLGGGSPGTRGEPSIVIAGSPVVGHTFALGLGDALENSIAIAGTSFATAAIPLPAYAATLHIIDPFFAITTLPVDASGRTPQFVAVPSLPAFLSGGVIHTQAVVLDPAAAGQIAFSSALTITFGERHSPYLYRGPAVGGLAVLATHDVDGDGLEDLIGIRSAPSDLGVMFANADGTFEGPIGLSAGTSNGLWSFAFDDLDLDGDTDIVWGNKYFNGFTSPSDLLGVSLNTGVRSFAPAQLLIGAVTNVVDLAVGDFNADGHPDIVTAFPWSHQKIALRFGNGNGTFGSQQVYNAPSQIEKVEAFDITGDGVDDVVVPRFVGDFAVYTGDPDGVLDQYQYFPVNYPLTAMDVGDFDADGTMDVVLLGATINEIALMRGLPGGGLAPKELASIPSGATGVRRVRVAGLDKIAVTHYPNPTCAASNVDVTATGLAVHSFGLPSETGWIVALDADNDGVMDIAQFGLDEDPSLYLSGPYSNLQLTGAAMALPLTTDLSIAGTDAPLAVADFDRDGHLDVATVRSSSVVTLLGNGDGTFSEALGSAILGSVVHTVQAADMDGDGFEDLVITWSSYPAVGIKVLLATGTGAFVEVADFPTPLPGVPSPRMGDIDEDGLMDIVYRLSPTFNVSTFYVHFGAGAGTFEPRVQFDVAGLSGTSLLELADLTGDGHLDLFPVPSAQTGSMVNPCNVVPGAGDGTFGPAMPFSCILGPLTVENTYPKAYAIADLNGDGLLDIVGLRAKQTRVSVTLSLGGGAFAPPTAYELGKEARSVSIADFDGDAIPDIFVESGAALVQVLPGVGDGTFPSRTSYALGVPTGHVAFGDFDGDSALDFVFGDKVGGSMKFASSNLYD